MSIHFGNIEKTKPEKQLEKSSSVLFNMNVTKAHANPSTIFHRVGGSLNYNRVKIVRDGDSYLHQDSYRKSPAMSEDGGKYFITTADFLRASQAMFFDCPRFREINVSVFVVTKVLFQPGAGKWGYIVGNDNGNYDKFIGIKSNSKTELSYGGGWPAKEYSCTYPTGVVQTEKHLISAHWMMTNSHIRFNNIVSTDSAFTANFKGNALLF